MATRSHSRAPRRRHRRRITLATIRRFTQSRWRVFRVFIRTVLASPPTVRAVVISVLILLPWLGVNWAYHAYYKPTEILFPLAHSLDKLPAETWNEYGSLFREHSTAIITPELLAALAQVEGGGNPVARTYWRWRLARNPFELYQPASSAVGMYQITEGTFREAKRYCIHDHVVAEDGPWLDPSSCWFNILYSRVVPSHAIEMTSALLDRRVASAIGRYRVAAATPERQQDLAAVIHLCGPGAGDAYAARGFRLAARQRCGDHDVGAYLVQVNAMKRRFARMAEAGL